MFPKPGTKRHTYVVEGMNPQRWEVLKRALEMLSMKLKERLIAPHIVAMAPKKWRQGGHLSAWLWCSDEGFKAEDIIMGYPLRWPMFVTAIAHIPPENLWKGQVVQIMFDNENDAQTVRAKKQYAWGSVNTLISADQHKVPSKRHKRARAMRGKQRRGRARTTGTSSHSRGSK